jgi:hypothetical protein
LSLIAAGASSASRADELQKADPADKPAAAEGDKPSDTPKPEAEKAAEPEKSAAEQEADAAKAEATKVITKYLEAVKAKKWDVVKRLTHPKTLEAIADVKKRKQIEDHRMALWAKAHESYMTEYTLSDATPTAKGGIVFPSSEAIFSVEDNGTEDGVHVEYLVLPVGGKWWVTDRRLGDNEFPEKTVPLAFKGYFDGEYTLPPGAGEDPVEPKKGRKK